MSAQWRGDKPASEPLTLVALTPAHLDTLMPIENAAYAFPWTRGNFIDSIVAGYPARVLLDSRGAMLGYFIAMAGVDEMHLLNITVAPEAQSRGHARLMIAALIGLCREQAAPALWLEVRQSNERARSIYARLGFVQQGVRKGYDPAPFGRREDAVVMSLKIGARDGLE